MLQKSILGALKATAKAYPNKIAIICGEQKVSYKMLWQGALSVSRYFKDLGIKRGDRVLLHANNSAAFAYGYFASHVCQAIAVPIEPQISRSRLAYIENQTQPAASFLNNDLSRLEEEAHRDEGVEDSEICLNANIQSDILFSTGTTGKPKGVVLTQGNLWAASSHINQFIGNSSVDREILTLPLSHSFGLGRLRCNILAGGTLVLLEGLAFIGGFFKYLENCEATAFSAVPTGIALILKLSGNKLANYADQLRYVEIGSAPMPLEHKQKLMKWLPNTRLCMHYGLTEASRSAFIEFHTHAHKLNSLGIASPGVDIEIRHKDRANEGGELWVRGSHVMHKYWNDASLTEQVLQDEWLNTGDIGHKDEEGFLYLCGRAHDMMNIGGRKVSPLEIEKVLERHPDIEAVACVGIESEQIGEGEEIYAYLEVKEGHEMPEKKKIVGFLRNEIESYKIPAKFILIDKVPTTPSGKVQRYLLKEYHDQSHTSLHSAL